MKYQYAIAEDCQVFAVEQDYDPKAELEPVILIREGLFPTRKAARRQLKLLRQEYDHAANEFCVVKIREW